MPNNLPAKSSSVCPNLPMFLLKQFCKRIEELPPSVRALSQLLLIASLIEKYVMDNKDIAEKKALQEWMDQVDEKLEQCINNGILSKEVISQVFEQKDFYLFLKNMMEDVRLEWDEEKLKLYRDFLIGAIISEIDLKQLHYIRRHLKDMRIEHIKILKWYEDGKYDSPHAIGSNYDSQKAEWYVLFGIKAEDAKNRTSAIKEARKRTAEIYSTFENDLATWGYLNLILVDSNSKRYYLTPLGKEFLNMIREQK